MHEPGIPQSISRTLIALAFMLLLLVVLSLVATGSQAGDANPIGLENVGPGIDAAAVTSGDAAGTLLGTAGLSADARSDDAQAALATSDFEISKTLMQTFPILPGQQITYQLMVTNTGPDDASGVLVVDTLPLKVTYQSCQASTGTCGLTPGTGPGGEDEVRWQVGNVPYGGTRTLRINVQVQWGASGTLYNRASVSSYSYDPDTGDNIAFLQTPITLPTSTPTRTRTRTPTPTRTRTPTPTATSRPYTTVFLPPIMMDYRPFGSDEFSATTLDSRWSWIFNDPSRWSLTARPGFLRILTDSGNVGLKNLALQTAPFGNFDVRTRLLFTPTSNHQLAGIVLFQDRRNYLMLGRGYCDPAPPTCIGNGIYFRRVENGGSVGSNFATSITKTGEAFLRVVRHGDTYTGYVSANGSNWTLVGTHTPNAGVVLSRVGLTAAQDLSDLRIPADFDYIRFYAAP